MKYFYFYFTGNFIYHLLLAAKILLKFCEKLQEPEEEKQRLELLQKYKQIKKIIADFDSWAFKENWYKVIENGYTLKDSENVIAIYQNVDVNKIHENQERNKIWNKFLIVVNLADSIPSNSAGDLPEQEQDDG